MSMVYHCSRGGGVAGSPAGAAESSCRQRGRGEAESVSELAAWHSYHGTNSPGTEETAANCRAARKETDRGRADADPAARVPVPISGSRPRRPKCQHAIRNTDGSLQGGCGCNTDLRAKFLLFAAVCIHIHTTAQQQTFCAYSEIRPLG